MRERIAGLFLVFVLASGAGGQPLADTEALGGPANAYGTRYAERGLVMPRGMLRGTFDVVLGDIDGTKTTTIDLGVAVSPVNHLEIGISRYRMGSFPSPDLLRAFGGDGLIPIIVQGDDVIPLGTTRTNSFGDMLAYVRAEASYDSIVDIGFDLGFLIPTASEFGLLIGLPMRFHGGRVFAFDTGIQINVDNITGEGGNVTSVSLPWNMVFNATDEVFLMLNSGFNALDIAGGGSALKSFPFGFGAGYTFVGRRTMADIFALFSWPLFGTVDPGSNNTEFWTVTIGANFYSPVLFGKSRAKARTDS